MKALTAMSLFLGLDTQLKIMMSNKKLYDGHVG